MARPLGKWGGEPRGNQTLARGFADRDPHQRIGSESGQRESNPHRQLGRLGSYRWTMSANVVSGIGETRTRIAWVQARHSPFEYDPEDSKVRSLARFRMCGAERERTSRSPPSPCPRDRRACRRRPRIARGRAPPHRRTTSSRARERGARRIRGRAGWPRAARTRRGRAGRARGGRGRTAPAIMPPL